MAKKIIELIPNISEGGAETLVKDYCLLLKDKGSKSNAKEQED